VVLLCGRVQAAGSREVVEAEHARLLAEAVAEFRLAAVAAVP
jgi:hypothetical protein